MTGGPPGSNMTDGPMTGGPTGGATGEPTGSATGSPGGGGSGTTANNAAYCSQNQEHTMCKYPGPSSSCSTNNLPRAERCGQGCHPGQTQRAEKEGGQGP